MIVYSHRLASFRLIATFCIPTEPVAIDDSSGSDNGSASMPRSIANGFSGPTGNGRRSPVPDDK